MSSKRFYPVKVAPVVALFALFAAGAAEGAAPGKEECLQAHGRGQDLREEGHLSRARQQFSLCSNLACPALVQADCARFSEELGQIVPTVAFVARGARANDLPDTQVYFDNVLLAERLDAGKPFEVDPGQHVVRFVHDGKEVISRVVINQGERNRTLTAIFQDAPSPVAPVAPVAPAPEPAARLRLEPASPRPEAGPRRPSLPLYVAGAGGVALVAGGALFLVGRSRVPDNCSLSTNECSAALGDPSFREASDATSLANVGLAVGAAGLATAAGGLVWYFLQKPQPTPNQAAWGALTGRWQF